jgi:hypothetical protein
MEAEKVPVVPDARRVVLRYRIDPGGALMTHVTVYSFKGYDTAKHRHILRPVKATLERIRRIDDAIVVVGSGEELPRLMVSGDGFRRPGTQ